MITGRLINPQIYTDSEGNKIAFDNDLVIEENGVEIHRQTVNLPYDMPDAEIEALVAQMVSDIATGIHYEKALKEVQELNPEVETVEVPTVPVPTVIPWDWVSWDMGA